MKDADCLSYNENKIGIHKKTNHTKNKAPLTLWSSRRDRHCTKVLICKKKVAEGVENKNFLPLDIE
jgi:hypothetical protein